MARARARRWPLGVGLTVTSRTRPRVRRGAGVVLPLVLLAACDSSVAGQAGVGAPPPPTTAQVAGQSLTDLAEAGALHVTGGLTTLSGDKVTVDLRVASTGEALGTLTVNGQRAKVVLLSKTPYLNGPAAFWAALPGIPDAKSTVVADRWVSVPPALLGVQIEDLFSPPALAQLLADGPAPTAQQPPEANRRQKVGGVDALAIDLSAGTEFVTPTAPHRVVGAKLASVGQAGPSAARDLDLAFTDATAALPSLYRDVDGQAATLAAPVDLITPVEEGSHRFAECGQASCAVIVDLTNGAKVAVRVSVSADWIGDGKPLGRCDTQTGLVAPGEQISATCTITSPQWTAFYQNAHSVPGQHPYRAEWSAVSLADPPDRKAVHAHATAKAPAKPAKNGAYVVYAIDHAKGGHARDMWKYGVVASGYWRDQAAQQLDACQSATGRMCAFHQVTTANDAPTAYAAQQQLIADYRASAKRCPAGQAVACDQK
ncbi:hypothetical protein [Labedaea rhizosphaerae]|uniref:hypothetical protein n=1 Tax=Labedaea rhizosphaerae TaxID=598644 RepID=UPI0010617560|nr:hypothetical protein [Labedaea rhizosphaerae]